MECPAPSVCGGVYCCDRGTGSCASDAFPQDVVMCAAGTEEKPVVAAATANAGVCAAAVLSILVATA